MLFQCLSGDLGKQYRDLVIGSNSFEIASKYGQKATDYLVEVREASNAGYAHPDELAELTLAAQSASDITAELASSHF